MKKSLWVFILIATLLIVTAACGQTSEVPSSSERAPASAASNDISKVPSESPSEMSEPALSSKPIEESEISIHDLKSGDEVSIVGQVASTGLVDGETLWVQVQQADGTFVIYHCQLKEEFLDTGEKFELLDVAKIKGNFLSLTDLQKENTSPLVTLCDCEIISG